MEVALMLQQMIVVIRGMKDKEKLNTLLATVVARFAQLEDPTLTAVRLRSMLIILEEGEFKE